MSPDLTVAHYSRETDEDTTMEAIILFVLWVGWAAWASNITNSKGHGVGLGLVLGFLLGLLGVGLCALLPATERGVHDDDGKKRRD